MTWGDIERTLEVKLRATRRNFDHRKLKVVCSCGKVLGLTQVSHSRGDVGPVIVGDVASQIHVTTPFFRELVGCTKNRPDYVAVRGHRGHD